jgi:hypothetical protein
MKKRGFFMALVGALFLFACSPNELTVFKHDLLWIDVTNKDTIYFSDLDDGVPYWREITDGNVPGYDVSVKSTKSGEGIITVTGHNPIKEVRFDNSLMGYDREVIPIINNGFTKRIDSIGAFRIILK